MSVETAPIFAAASASGAKSSTEKITLPKVSSKKELSELLSTHEHKKELLQLELDTLGEDWLLALQDEFTKPYFLTVCPKSSVVYPVNDLDWDMTRVFSLGVIEG